MQILRNIYFWLTIGSIAFFFLASTTHSFGMGFFTACILAVIWYAVDLRMNPGPPRGLKPRYWDYETGELRTEEDDDQSLRPEELD